MSNKLAKNTYPNGVTPESLTCYGPPATKDTEFEGCRSADLGCFKQDGVDSNKYYCLQVCTDANGRWYLYQEWSRQGAKKPDFQIVECSDEKEAMREFVKKCHEKNTKRGQWDTVAGQKMFVPKGKDDLYAVRVLAARTHGLPSGRNIAVNSAIVEIAKPKAKKPAFRCDTPTTQLMRDLLGGAVTYTKTTLQGGTIPVQSAIDEARTLLDAAKEQVTKIGNDVLEQVNNADLKKLTYLLYSRIPKIKPLNVAESAWILSQENIWSWVQDLDAFETALQSGSMEEIAHEDPMENMPLDMAWIDPKSDVGQWLSKWWANASRNRHRDIGSMKIKNMWEVNRFGDVDTFNKEIAGMKNIHHIEHRPLHQERNRPDISKTTNEQFWQNNVAMLFHGTRTVNVPGILRTNLKMPNQLKGVHITAAMFGSGIYWADDWRKSAGYTSLDNARYAAGGGSVKGRQAFMFVADVLLGAAHLAPRSFGYTEPPKGYDCVFGKGGHTTSTLSRHGLMNNEWIVYKSGRNVLRYLCEFAA